MPELPEVETIVQGLSKVIIGKEIMEIIIREEKIIAYPSSSDFRKQLINKKIIGIRRRGKYILIMIEDELTLVIHLRMTGKLFIKPSDLTFDKHSHIIFRLDNAIDLRFNNVRKFGRMYLVDDNSWERAGGLDKLGPEPLDDDFTLGDFHKMLRKRKSNIKGLLLNQSFLAGLGNIYVDEALFRAGILPFRRTDTLKNREIERLYKGIRNVLKMGIKYGGTSFRDYRNARGEKGSFQEKLLVYQREGKECPVCGEEIVKEKVAGRGTHFCPHCQK